MFEYSKYVSQCGLGGFRRGATGVSTVGLTGKEIACKTVVLSGDCDSCHDSR
ncbi:MAG: hypothetical protein QNJ41_00960 [Xenococcaceae cyanobacterium MO_188.B32]|nr:hypothetical protein [Xenococcaceae cyanobacterium MO_188.B32]